MQAFERTGLGIAVAAHLALFFALSVNTLAPPKSLIPPTPPIDVELVEDTGLTTTAPNPSQVEPAPSIAPDLGPSQDEPEPAIVLEPEPQPAPVTKPAPPKPSVKAVAKPVPKPAPARQVASRTARQPATERPRGSRLGTDFLKGIGDRPSPSTSQAPRAAAGPATASIARLLREQLKPHWKAPTGADAELLHTDLRVALNRDGEVTDVTVIGTTGQTDSNRGQVKLHQEAAVKAVRTAAPFRLPAEYYDYWKLLARVGFDRRLS